jgi:hypothetical protein
MNYDADIQHLAGETLALQCFLVVLCSKLSADDPTMRSTIKAAFDIAENLLERAAKPMRTQELDHSLRIIDELRTATFGDAVSTSPA